MYKRKSFVPRIITSWNNLSTFTIIILTTTFTYLENKICIDINIKSSGNILVKKEPSLPCNFKKGTFACESLCYHNFVNTISHSLA